MPLNSSLRRRAFLRGILLFGVLPLLVVAALAWFLWPSRPKAAPLTLAVYPCEPAVAAPAVDGDLADWQGALWLPFGAAEQAGWKPDWTGRDDFSAAVALRWDRRYLYGAVAATDNAVHIPLPFGAPGSDRLLVTLGDGLRRRTLVVAPAFLQHDDILAITRGDDGVCRLIAWDGRAVDLGLRFDAAGRPVTAHIPCGEPWAAGLLTRGWDAAPAQIDGRTGRRIVATEAAIDVIFGAIPPRTMVITAVAPQPGGTGVSPVPDAGRAGSSAVVPPRGTEAEARLSGTDGAAAPDAAPFAVLLNGAEIARVPESGAWRGSHRFEIPLPPQIPAGRNQIILRFAPVPNPDGTGVPPVPLGRTGVPPVPNDWVSGPVVFSIDFLPASGESAPPERLVVGDVDGDGVDELVALLPTPGDGAFFDLGCIDVHADAVAEPLPARVGRATPLALKQSHAAPARVVAWPLAGDAPSLAVAVDLDGLAGDELAWIDGGVLHTAERTRGGWQPLADAPLPHACIALVAGDFLGERGRQVCALYTATDGVRAAFWRLDRRRRLQLFADLALGSECLDAAAGDLDGDGRAELVVLTAVTDKGSELSIRSLDGKAARRVSLAGRVVRLACGDLLGDGNVGALGMSAPAFTDAETDDADAAPMPVAGSSSIARRTAHGYTLEFRIPWSALADPQAGAEMALRLRFEDSDGRRNHTLTFAPGGEGRLRLLAAALPADKPIRDPDALRALLAVGLDINYLIDGDSPIVTVLRGAADKRLPTVSGVSLIDARGRRWNAAPDAASPGPPVAESWRVASFDGADGRMQVAVFAGGRKPLLTLPWESRRQEYRKLLVQLGKTGDALAAAAHASIDGAMPTLLVRGRQLEDQIRNVPNQRVRPGLEGLAAQAAALADLVGRHRKGEDVLADERGVSLRGYFSSVDASVQPYGLYVPEHYDPQRRYPLIVQLHGAGYGALSGYPPRAVPGCIVLSPHGRDWTDYMYIGEEDVLRAIAEVASHYSIDPARIYLTGHSMGGTGSWYLGVRYPDIFAAIAPGAANTDGRVWDRYWRAPGAPPPMADFRERMKRLLSSITYAENAATLPVLAVHGDADRVVYVEHDERMVSAVRDAGGTAAYREVPDAGHGLDASVRRDETTWLLSQERTRPPRTVALTVNRPPAGAYWLTILTKKDRLDTASAEAWVTAPNRIEVRTHNAASWRVDLNRWQARAPRAWHNLLADPTFTAADVGRPGAAWQVSGAGVRADAPGPHGGVALRLIGDDATPQPQLVQVLPEPLAGDERYAFGFWVRGGSAPPEAPQLQIFRVDDDGSVGEVIAAAPFEPSDAWQYVSVEGWVDGPAPTRLGVAVVLADRPAGGELQCADACLAAGGGLPAFDVHRDPVALLDTMRTTTGSFEWRPLNPVCNASFEHWGAAGAVLQGWRVDAGIAARSDSALFGDAALALTLPKDAGDGSVLSAPVRLEPDAGPWYAGVWARAESGSPEAALVVTGAGGMAVSNTVTLDGVWRRLEAVLPQDTGDRVDLLVTLRGAGARCLLDGAYVLPVLRAPSAVRCADDATLIDRARPLTVVVNDQPAFAGVAPADGRLVFGAPEPPPRGPIETAFLDPFLLVYGTRGPAAEQEASRQAAEDFLADWRFRYHCPCRIKPDSAITFDDMADYNLIVYGGPRVNRLAAAFNPVLPLRFDGDAVICGNRRFTGPGVGFQFIVSNPVNPRRALVLLAGADRAAMFQINKRFGNWFDWQIYENRKWYDYVVFDDRSLGPGTFLAFGFLNRRDGIDPAMQFLGDETLRGAVAPWRVPPSTDAEPARAACLTDLAPARLWQRKGPMRFDRSYEGNLIRLGGEVFARGLGVRSPSEAEFHLGGRYDRLTAVVGVDLEGRATVSRARAEGEIIQFRVYGDGRLLAESERLHWDSPPETMDVDISGVDVLVLSVAPAGGLPWLTGSASWGGLRLHSADNAPPQ